jgi:hypothetical protein
LIRSEAVHGDDIWELLSLSYWPAEKEAILKKKRRPDRFEMDSRALLSWLCSSKGSILAFSLLNRIRLKCDHGSLVK